MYMRSAVLFCLFWSGSAVWAQDWKLDTANSKINFVIRQMNVPVEGGFKRFSAQATFDPAKVESGKFSVSVDLSSIDTGSADGDSEVQRPTWFDMAHFPKATFVSKTVLKQAGARFLARGEISIKGKSRTVEVPFTMDKQGNGTWVASGSLPIRRSDFGIGGGDWNDVVANEATVNFRMQLMP